MRSTRRLFAEVKSAARYLEANAPTGLTGIHNHPSPRPALIYTYRQTLDRLKQLPASSVYRQSAEALTNHRLKIIEDTIPEGYEQWMERVRKQIDSSAADYEKYLSKDGSLKWDRIEEDTVRPWDGKLTTTSGAPEGSNTQAEADMKARMIQEEMDEVDLAETKGPEINPGDLPVEPSLTVDQINSIETQIGAGLIEEVLLVAQGELKVVDEMLENKPWEPLEEQIPAGQWSYFDRGDVV